MMWRAPRWVRVLPVVEQATCTGGVVVPRDGDVADDAEGITYSMEPDDLGDGTEASDGDGDGACWLMGSSGVSWVAGRGLMRRRRR